jgi:hypothetical protein
MIAARADWRSHWRNAALTPIGCSAQKLISKTAAARATRQPLQTRLHCSSTKRNRASLFPASQKGTERVLSELKSKNIPHAQIGSVITDSLRVTVNDENLRLAGRGVARSLVEFNPAGSGKRFRADPEFVMRKRTHGHPERKSRDPATKT